MPMAGATFDKRIDRDLLLHTKDDVFEFKIETNQGVSPTANP